jgi:hypothetical protein
LPLFRVMSLLAVMGGFMIRVTANEIEVCPVHVHGQTRQMDGCPVRIGRVPSDFHPDAVFASQDGRQQGQRFDDVAVSHGFSVKKPFAPQRKGLCWMV